MRKTFLRKYSLPLVPLIILTGLFFFMPSCGGGSGGASRPMQTVIVAQLFSFPTADVPLGFAPSGVNSAATVEILDAAIGATISTAIVSMNSVSLAYNPTQKTYQGYFNVSPGDAVILTVTINGKSYTASGTQFTTYPVITSPTPSTSWPIGNSHTVTWSGGTPLPSYNGSYVVAILDASDPNGNLVWPSDNYLWDVDMGVTSNIIPANSMSLGNRLAIAGISQEIIVSDYSSYYIDLYLAGLDYVPFTIVPSPTPTNVTATPGNGQVSLSWTPVNDALSYNIYWSETEANANKSLGTQIAGVSNPYVHTVVTNSTPYYYTVTAVTGSGESAESTPVAQAVPGTSLMGGSMQGYPLTLTNMVTPLAGTRNDYGYADCAGTAARFNFPQGITTDGSNLYVADTNNHTIRKIVISNGEVTSLAGRAGFSGSDDGIGPAARFNGPVGITTDGTNLYVADTYNHAIRKIVIATGAVTTLAGSAGLPGSTNGTGSAARFNSPQGMTTDNTNLYVADTWNHTIRKIVTSTGVVSTLAGSAGISGSADGTGSAARFNYPRGITTDGANLYVADTNSYTIRKIVISTGDVTTLAGKAGIFSESTDGTGTTATFADPTGITTDGTNLYVTDVNPSYGWHTPVRKVEISTGKTTTLPIGNFYIAPAIVTDGISFYILDFEGVARIR